MLFKNFIKLQSICRFNDIMIMILDCERPAQNSKSLKEILRLIYFTLKHCFRSQIEFIIFMVSMKTYKMGDI